MQRLLITDIADGINLRLSTFRPDSDSPAEYSAIFTCAPGQSDFSETSKSLTLACRELGRRLGPDVKAVFKRYYLSDATNQCSMLDIDGECATSVIGQSPLDGSKVALWVRYIQGADTERLDDGLYCAKRANYTHYFQGGAHIPGADSERAARTLLDNYVTTMAAYGCTLARDCARTWFFVRDVDVNYAGLVRGRNEVFSRSGLTPSTHFIASTGICGANPDRTSLVTMDTYTVHGLAQGQMRHLYAPTHLNPTYEYGVAFERGTMIDYADRRHVLISGTASIDNKGRVVHPGDIRSQTLRMWENVGALLAEAGCGFDDVMQMIVYLRDIADYPTVSRMYDERFPDIPRVIVLAPVCRPEWLIEMECMAIKPIRSDFKPF